MQSRNISTGVPRTKTNAYKGFTDTINVGASSVDVSVSVVGLLIAAALGVLLVTGDASIGAAGVSATSDVGTVTASNVEAVAVAGVSMTSDVGTVTASNIEAVAVTGVSMASDVGTVAASNIEAVAVDGVAALSAVGSSAPSGDAQSDAVGSIAVADVGAAVADGGPVDVTVAATGEQLDTAIGDVVASAASAVRLGSRVTPAGYAAGDAWPAAATVNGLATPRGLVARSRVGSVATSGEASAAPATRVAQAASGRSVARGIRNLSDEQLAWLIGEVAA